MKILNSFTQLQTKNNFTKTIEIRKANSFDRIWKKYVSFSHTSYKDGTISDDIYYTDTNGLLKELMYNTDLPNCHCYPELAQCQCIKRTYWLVFNGYQRMKVSELKKWLDTVNKYWWQNHYEEDGNVNWEYHLDEMYVEEFKHNYLPMWLVDNISWLGINWHCAESYNTIPDWIFNEYLKDEEYCIVYFIDKEETFKANGWELK